jgi:hypothetical protein
MVRPRSKGRMEVEVMGRVCPRRVRTGVGVVGEEAVDDGGSAGRMVRVKSALPVRRTLEEGKKLRDVTVLRWGLECECG